MYTAAIIAEFDPFHNGHMHLIETTRKAGATHVLCIMSGNFVQRGDVAIFDKFSRARAALENGVDLVIELPARFSLMSAEGFARGAVGFLSELNCADMLAFGSECGDIAALEKAATAVRQCICSEKFYEQIKLGKSYPAALQLAVKEYCGEDIGDILKSPNNTLGIEYLNALEKLKCRIKPFTVKRTVPHGEQGFENGEFASASLIRQMIRNGEDYSALAPVINEPTADISRLERAVLSKLRSLSEEEFCGGADCANGLGERLYKTAKKAGSLDELYFLAKNKSITLARVRRAALCLFLGITKEFSPPAYIRVLGMNERGKEILSAAKCRLPVDTSLKALSTASALAHRQAYFEARLGDIYSLAFETPIPCGYDFTAKPVIIRNKI